MRCYFRGFSYSLDALFRLLPGPRTKVGGGGGRSVLRNIHPPSFCHQFSLQFGDNSGHIIAFPFMLCVILEKSSAANECTPYAHSLCLPRGCRSCMYVLIFVCIVVLALRSMALSALKGGGGET